MEKSELLAALDLDIIERFKVAVEIGKWPDGRALTEAQRETCMQAIIVYEHENLAQDQRTGYVPPKGEPCDTKGDDVDQLTWVEDQKA